MGAAPASTATYGFHFQGQNILASTIHQLGAKGLTTGHKLLLAGCSAGGRGVLVNVSPPAASSPSAAALRSL